MKTRHGTIAVAGLASLLLALSLMASPAQAIVISPTGTTADVTYTEPTTNADGSPLNDLDHCNVYAKPKVGSETKFPNVAASKLSGGASITTNVGVAAGSEYTITVSCTDKVGNESLRSPSVVLDALAPAAPK